MTLSPNICYLCKCELAAVWHVSENKYQSYTHILTVSNGMNMGLLSLCFSVLKMYIQRFTMKTCEAFHIRTKCVKNKWKGNRVHLGERKLENLIIP